MKRLLGIVGTALLMSVLVVGTAFAGKTNGNGGGADNGNKNGTWRMNETNTCQDKYSYEWAGYYDAWAYDLNGNGYVCVKSVDSDWFAVDDVAP